MNNYYIYIYLDPRKYGKYCYDNICFLYEPIYIGKGKDRRYKNIKKRNNYFKNKINKIKKSGLEPIIFKLYDDLFEKQSLELEIKLINEIGRIDLVTGPLLNMTDGGEGTSGYSHKEKTLIKFRKKFLDIKKEFKKRGYILLTKEFEYKNAHQKLKYICPERHEGFISWTNFQRGQGCPIDGNKSGHKKQRKNFNDIKKLFELRNFKLLTEEKDYENSKTKLKYICQEDHEGYICWSDFKSGYGCPICFNKLRNKKMRGKNSILIIQDVIQIKLLLKEGKLTQKEIADIFGVHQVTISRIKIGKIWSYVK